MSANDLITWHKKHVQKRLDWASMLNELAPRRRKSQLINYPTVQAAVPKSGIQSFLLVPHAEGDGRAGESRALSRSLPVMQSRITLPQTGGIIRQHSKC